MPLDPKVFHYACHRLQFTLDLDLFATSENAQVTRLLSAYPMTRSCGVNAFNYDWTEDAGYANPPWSLIPRVLRKLCAEGARVMLVFHEWPNAPWYPIVRELELRSFLVTSPCYLSPPDVPSTQTPLEHTDINCGRCSSNPSSTPIAGTPHPRKASALQPSDRNPTYPQLQRTHPRDTRRQSSDPADPSASSGHRRNLSLREPTRLFPEGSRLPRHTQNRPQTPESRASVPPEILPAGYR